MPGQHAARLTLTECAGCSKPTARHAASQLLEPDDEGPGWHYGTDASFQILRHGATESACGWKPIGTYKRVRRGTSADRIPTSLHGLNTGTAT